MLTPPTLLGHGNEGWPLSVAQERLYSEDVLSRVRGRSNVICAAWRLHGPLDQDSLRRALNVIGERHGALRTAFLECDGTPCQIVDHTRPLPRLHVDALDTITVSSDLPAIIRREADRPFDLSTGHLWRSRLLRLDDTDHVLISIFHHIVFDGWSLGIFTSELQQLYEAFCSGRESPLAPVPVQYADFAVGERQRLRDGTLDDDLDYWQHRLAGIPECLELPCRKPRASVRAFTGDTHVSVIDGQVLGMVKTLARQRHATLYMTLLATLALLLGRYAKQSDVVIGSPIARRSDPRLRDVIGVVLNLLAMRVTLKPQQRFADLLDEVRQAVLEAYEHQDAPFGIVADACAGPRDPHTTPLFQVLFVLQDAAWQLRRLHDLNVESLAFPVPQTGYDLEVHAHEAEGRLHVRWHFNRELFEPRFIAQLARGFSVLLESLALDQGCSVFEVSILDEGQRCAIADWNATAADVPLTTLPVLFESQAALTPDATAIVMRDAQVTYAELNRRANRIAHMLIARGAGPEDVVAVALDRSVDMIVAMLAILKAGAAYCPLDLAHPSDRLLFMARDASPCGVLTSTADRFGVPGPWQMLLDSDEIVAELNEAPDHNPSDADRTSPLARTHPAYVVYTSGSSGQPKGVIGLHGGAVNRLIWGGHAFPFTSRDMVLAKSSISFLDGFTEVLGPLLHGATVAVADSASARDPELLSALIERHGVSRITLVPTLLNALLDVGRASALAKCRLWIVSGEALSPRAAERFAELLPAATLLNLFGMSEASGDSTFAVCGASSAAIGRPIWNTRVDVLDARMRPVPIGVPGELYVAGDGLARGYLRRPSFTAERFVPDSAGRGARLYRTGDLVKWRFDGQLEFLGRADQQVKIRGVRVEPDEIAARLLEHPQVGEAAVTPIHVDGHSVRLVAHIVPTPGETPTPRDVRQWLRRVLPHAFVPQTIIVRQALPLLGTGKVDRQALRLDVTTNREPSTPRTPLEARLCRIFSDALDRPDVGCGDDFFELGGDSLTAMRVTNRVQKLTGVTLDLEALLTAPTVTELVAALQRQGPIDLDPGSLADN